MPRIRRSEMESLEALLLGVMDTERTVTPHGLYSRLVLSPASTMRALQRLRHLGLATQEEGDGARKTAYTISEKGRSTLRRGWRAYVWSGRSDPEEILRFITLADLLGEEWLSEDCPSRLLDIAGERRARASSLVSRAKAQKPSILSRYGYWRALCEAGKMKGESQALDRIAGMIAEGSFGTEQIQDEDGQNLG